MPAWVWFRGEPVSSYFLWLLILLFLIDVNAVCYHVHSVPWFWFKHVGNFGMIAVWLLPPWCLCTLCIQSSSLYATKWSMLLTCMQLTLVTWYVASILCCHYWMQKVIHLKYGSFVWPCGFVRGTTYMYFLPIYFSAWNRWCTYHGWHFEPVDFIVVECSF